MVRIATLDEATDCRTLGRWQRGENNGYDYESKMRMP